MRHPAPADRAVVVKIGTSSLTGDDNAIDPRAISTVVDNVESSWEAGHPTLLVTSGAIAAGLPVMGLAERPKDVPGLQVAAALGQSRLMTMYDEGFRRKGRQIGQVLLTRDVLAKREQYLHAREALERMLALGVVPVVNENDTVVVDELRFGDNDRLAAIVSHLVGAGMLVLLTDTPGIFSDDPWLSSNAELLSAVRHTDQVLDQLRANATRGTFGSGGVATKVAAARMAAWSGIPTVITSASEPGAVSRAVAGEEIGTWVSPRESGLSARKLWIAFGSPAEGYVTIDDGAVRALVGAGKSLLPAGVTGVEGSFGVGSAIEVRHRDELVAKGLAALASEDIVASQGQHSSIAGGAVIHRDDLVILA